MSQTFADLGLMAELTRAVADEGYTHPTPVQIQAIPVILQGRDVLAGAQTGTGKTAGFTLPLLQRLEPHTHHGGRHAVRALILTPTRELAAQVEESVRTYGRHLKLRSTLIYGGVNINPQIDAVRKGVDILVATPGRLLDHLGQKTVDLSHVEILVLDEADRMLDMGFIRDIRKILALLPPKRQNLLFSATYTDEIRELADGLLHDPAMVEVARRNAESELVMQRVHPVAKDRKRALLSHLVGTGDWRQVLVFTRTKHGANRLAQQLVKDGIEACAIHGNKSQGARTRALADFKAGTVRVLVATDIAARGLDIEQLPHVVNYELPNVPEDYVHRIGRTGRAGSTGEAISLVCSEEEPFLRDIEKLIKRRIERTEIAGFEPGSQAPEAERQAQAADRADSRGNLAREPAVEGAPREGRRRRGRGRGRDRRPEGREQQPQQTRAAGEGRGGERRRDGRQGAVPGQRGDAQPRGEARGNAARPGGESRGATAGRRPPRGGAAARGHAQPGMGSPRQPLVEEPWRSAPAAPAPAGGDEAQPLSNEGQLFPSSAHVYGDGSASAGAPRNRPKRKGRRGGAPAALLVQSKGRNA